MNDHLLYSIVRLDYRPVCNPESWELRSEEACNDEIDVWKA